MDFLPKEISDYAENYSSHQSELLARLFRETHSNVLIPRMISGPLQGRVLSMISNMIQPSRILEIGTYTGYSALCMAEGLKPNGILHTIDKNEELETMIRRYFNESAYASQLQLHIGDALEVIPTLEDDFDLVFIDADKPNYLAYYNLLIDRLKPNSYIMADNVLWSGKVAKQIEFGDEDTLALHAFNEAIQNDNRVENVLLPVRDGIMLIRVL